MAEYETLTLIGPHNVSDAGDDENPGRPPRLLVWPETVIRTHLNEDLVCRQRIADFVTTLETPLLLGALARPSHGGEQNSAFLFTPGATNPQIYGKRRLLMFGESVPIDRLRHVGWRTTGEFVAGDPSEPLTLRSPSGGPSLTFAASICFEATFPGAFNEAVRSGATFLVNLTDDGWFGDTDEPYQHLNATILRAVETRRWLVRASGSGISAFIAPDGETVASIPLRRAAVLAYSVQPATTITPYVRWGDWPLTLSVLILTVTVITALRRGS